MKTTDRIGTLTIPVLFNNYQHFCCMCCFVLYQFTLASNLSDIFIYIRILNPTHRNNICQNMLNHKTRSTSSPSLLAKRSDVFRRQPKKRQKCVKFTFLKPIDFGSFSFRMVMSCQPKQPISHFSSIHKKGENYLNYFSF